MYSLTSLGQVGDVNPTSHPWQNISTLLSQLNYNITLLLLTHGTVEYFKMANQDVPMVVDSHDQDSCTPDPSSASLNPFPSDQFLNNEATNTNRNSDTAGQVAGATSGAELLQRLSLANASHPHSSVTHPQDHPDLDLSGRIISAAFCVPYNLGFRPGKPWVGSNP